MFGYVYTTYTEELELELAKGLEVFPNKIIHGNWSIAAGPALSVDLILSVAQQIPAEVVGGLITSAAKEVASFLKRKLSENEGYDLNSLNIQMTSYDVKVFGNGSDLPIQEIFTKVDSFVQRERKAGRLVGKVQLPCSVNENFEYESGRWLFEEANYSLWLVEYKDGAEIPYAAYDEANDILTLNPGITKSALFVIDGKISSTMNSGLVSSHRGGREMLVAKTSRQFIQE
jgi:hypothetical protein